MSACLTPTGAVLALQGKEWRAAWSPKVVTVQGWRRVLIPRRQSRASEWWVALRFLRGRRVTF